MGHPGGTVANYWFIKNANHVTPRNASNYDYCYRKLVVDKLPAQTFNPANFSHGIVTFPPVDMQIQLYGNDSLNQANALNDQIGGVDSVKYVELRNEY